MSKMKTIVKQCTAGFNKMQASASCTSLLKKHLTKDVLDSTKNLTTPTFGSSLMDCIQSGVENLDSGVGLYAPDAEAYTTFKGLFDPVIETYHRGFAPTDKHPAFEFGDADLIGDVDPEGKYVVSTRIRGARSVEGLPFNPCMTEEQYGELETKVSGALKKLTGELKGTYHPLTGMSKEVQQQLIDDHFLFKEGDRFLQAANASRFWPTGRGIYYNDSKTFLVWCGEEDHIRIISMQMGGHLGQVYKRLTTAISEVGKLVDFSHDERLGFLSFCPTNLGTSIRASVHIKLPKLASDYDRMVKTAGNYGLQVRGTSGEHSEAIGGVYDISNLRRLGLTEFETVSEMQKGIMELIKIEESL